MPVIVPRVALAALATMIALPAVTLGKVTTQLFVPDAVFFAELTGAAAPDSMIALLKRLQFPVFATFLKLTLTNECLLRGYPQGRDGQGRITFSI